MSISDGAWLGVELREGGVAAAVAWPDGTAMVLPLASSDAGGSGWPSRSDRPATPAWDATPFHGNGGTATVPQLQEWFRLAARGAVAAVGEVPAAVTLVVPAGWGSRQLPVVRQAAAAAGLGVVEVMSAAVAVGWHLLAGGVRLDLGHVVLVFAADAGGAATVLRRTPAGFEMAATVDMATVAAETAAAPVRDGPRDEGLVREVVHRAVVGAQVEPGMFDLVCAVGSDVDPAVGRVLGEVCGAEPMLVAEPEVAALLGAVQRGPAPEGIGRAAARRVGWPDVVAVLLPGVWSVVLFGQFLAGSVRYGLREKLGVPGMLLAAWGGLAFAAVFGLIAVAGGLLLGAVARQDAVDELAAGRGGAGPAWMGHRLQGLALGGGALGGVGLAGVYALLAAAYFDLDLGPLLRWSVLPVLPGAVAVAGVAVLVWRRPDPPGGSWLRWLRFPPLAAVVAGFGALLVSFDETGQPWLLAPLAWLLQQWLPSGQMTIIGPVGRLGGACLGAGVALLLVRRARARLLLGVPLAVLVAGLLSWRVTGAVAVGFALVVAGWWAMRAAWLLLRPRLLRPPRGTPDSGLADDLAASTPAGAGGVDDGGGWYATGDAGTDAGGWGGGGNVQR